MDDDERWVCADCVGDPYLKKQIAAGDEQACDFCREEGPAITIDELADFVEAAFETFYARTSDQPDAFESAMLRDRELSYEWDRSGEEVIWAIAGATEVSEEIAGEVLEILSDRHSDFDSAAAGEECEFDPDSYYERKGPNDIEFQLEWLALERSIKKETRFFNKEAEAILARLFRGIDAFQTRDGRPVIRVAGPGTDLSHFSRARVFHTERELGPALERPDSQLGPPPSAVATAGRMNARGVALFYGATDPAAALAEVRPPVGSRALVGRFDLLRPLRLLDIDALQSVYVEGSVFDPGHMARLELAKFLQGMSSRITMPVMPGDEATEYLITQVMADYLASDSDLDLDGLLYPSVQVAGDHQNVVLFRRASKVREIDLLPGSEVTAHLDRHDEDEMRPTYWVSERIPPPPEDVPEKKETFGLWRGPFIDPFAEPDDDREPALAVALDQLHVHHIEAVAIKSDAVDVTRHRSTLKPQKFARANPLDI